MATEKFYIVCNKENIWTLTDADHNDQTISLRDEYRKYWQKIVNGENFALVRYADGERALILGLEIHAIDGWSAGRGVTALGAALRDSLNIVDERFVYGISCPCCDSAAYYWYSQHLQGRNITFSNIWVNENFATFHRDFQTLKRDTVLITNYRGQGKRYGELNVVKHYLTTDDDSVRFWEQQGENFIRRIISEVGYRKNLLFAISAGPMSELIIAALFKHNPDNCYIDFGSALDFITHERATRGYMRDDYHTKHQNCWMFDPAATNFDVDVVLSAYRRPEVLAQQLAAVRNQTLAPRRVLLYQDAVESGDKIVISDEILSKFDACEIANENGGVWKRFEYAARATTSPYVCLFDDDTIPGQRIVT